jgi:O-antigen/teichoic acid export membrane protein
MLRVALIRIIYTTIMFLAGLVLSNLALPEKFGSISLLILNASLLSLITGFGADSMVVYKVSNGQWNTTQAFQFTWRTILIQLTIFVFLEFGSWFIFHQTFLSAEGSSYLAIDSIYFIGLVIVEKYLALFYSLYKSKAVNIILAFIASVYLLLLLLFYYFIKPDFVYILYLFAFESLVQAVALIVFFGVKHSRNLSLEHKEFWGAIKLSSIVMATNVVQLFAYRLDFWLLKYFYGSYEVGLYAQANKFANLSWIIPNIFAQLLLPKFASVDKTRTKEVFSVAFYLNLIILLITILCTQFFYSFYLDPEYKDGLRSFYLMLPGYFFWASVIYFGAFVSASGKFLYNLVGSSLCVVLIFLADIILIPSYGIEGAAIANSVSYTAVFFVYQYIFIKKFSFRWSELLWPRKRALPNVINFFTK